jgi:TonB family protein
LPISEEILRNRLVGKQFFLRGGWLGDSLSFTEHGFPTGHPATGSFTLSVIQINKVDLNKHHVEIEGSRYALHFLGNLPYDNTANEVERINITPKKKTVHIAIAREQLLKSKKYAHTKPAPATAPTAAPSPETTEPAAPAQPAAPIEPQVAQQPVSSESAPGAPGEAGTPAPPPTDVTYTTSPAHAAQVLNDALDRIFAPALDDKMRAHLPEFWQLYYQSQSTGKRFDPHDGSVFRANTVDQQAKLLSSIAPQSNEFAQANGIVGQALYRVVVSADGTPTQIAAERPIGFGLDENAVAAIRKATFRPAQKNGQPVAELLDLSVLFRIYSNRTSGVAPDSGEATNSSESAQPAPAVKPALPGPYSVQRPPSQPEQAPQQDAAPAANPPASAPDTGAQPAAPQQAPPQPASPQQDQPQSPAPAPSTPQTTPQPPPQA